MAKIHTFKISNYRCIEKFEQVLIGSNFVCLIGRGDSGKTTILNAISAVLSPNWNYNFYDTDFYKGNIDNPIEIEVSLFDLPTELLTDSKYGLYKRLLNSDNKIIDDIISDEFEDIQDVLTIKLVVNQELEPRWYVVNNREHQEDVEIKASDRAKLNVFIVSDYLDRHFSWSKGTPLYSLLKQMDVDVETNRIITEANRKAKDALKQSDSFNSFDTIIANIKKAASALGIAIVDLEALIDLKNTIVKEGNITLHNDGIPYRMSGKGSRRLLSIAIQLELAKKGGLVLIDEIEQGLEPDRARFLVKQLKDCNQGQVFITTHSSHILVELEAKDIFLKNIASEQLYSYNKDFQGCIRKNPEAFFAKKIIICEGSTEIGICRALNNFRIKNNQDNIAILGVALADGQGSNFVEYCLHFKESGFDVCAFCDSDDVAINNKKQELRDCGVIIVDCDNNKAIEQQLFDDLPWAKVKRLLRYAVKEKSEQSILAMTAKSSLEELKEQESPGIRTLLGDKAKEHGWYKRIDHGEKLGKLWFNSLSDLEGKTLKIQYDNLTSWINR
jgi:putative ATP-dependent endonuclease of the OLD family